MDFQDFVYLLEGITSKELQALQILTNYRLTEAQQTELYEMFGIDAKIVERTQHQASEFGLAQMELDMEDEFQLDLELELDMAV